MIRVVRVVATAPGEMDMVEIQANVSVIILTGEDRCACFNSDTNIGDLSALCRTAEMAGRVSV